MWIKFYDVEDVTSKLKINSWMQKILLDTATKKDYWELKEWYDSTTRNKEYFSALCLSMDGKIVYQRGKVLHTENKEYIRQMEEVGGGEELLVQTLYSGFVSGI